MPHVCHLITALGLGGAEQTVYNLVRYDDDTQFTVCCLESGGELIPRIRGTGVDMYVCGEQFRFDPVSLFSLFRYLSNKDIDILHTHLPYAQVVGRLVANMAGIDTVVSTQHSAQSHYHPVTGWLERLTAPVDTATVAVSEGVKTSFTVRSGNSRRRNWHTVYNGIDISGFNNAVSKSAAPVEGLETKTVFLNVGRCVRAKNQLSLLVAMTDVLESIGNAHLIVVGDGPRRDTLQKRAKTLGIQEHVTFPGKVTPVEPYYAAADVFVLPSIVEGLPITLLEAMAAELPVVASDIPGVSEVIQDSKTGRLVPLGQDSNLADAMVAMAENEPEAMGKRGFEHARENFNVEKMVEAYQRIYANIA